MPNYRHATFLGCRYRFMLAPPLVIATILLIEVLTVSAIDFWVFRQGRSHATVHAEQRTLQEIDARFGQGVVMLHARQFDHAVTAFHRVLELSPDMPEAHVNMGFALLGTGHHREARDFFAEALVIRPQQNNARYGIALALEGLGERHEAVQEMFRYLGETDPNDPYRAKADALLANWRSELTRQHQERVANTAKGKKVGAGRTAR
jgi:tetratricopeptide (TPR) repeat protein